MRLLLLSDVLHLSAGLTDDPVARLQQGAGLAHAIVLVEDQRDDLTRLRRLVGGRNRRLDPQAGDHLDVHDLPLLLSGAVDHLAILDDGVVVSEKLLHTTPLRDDVVGELHATFELRNRHEDRLLQLGPREDPHGTGLVELDNGKAHIETFLERASMSHLQTSR